MLDNRFQNFLCYFSHSAKDRPLGTCKIKVFPYARKVAYETTLHMEDKGSSIKFKQGIKYAKAQSIQIMSPI